METKKKKANKEATSSEKLVPDVRIDKTINISVV